MAQRDVAAALERTGKVLQRQPCLGLHDDIAATARWEGGLRAIASHPAGHQVITDMPAELGGSGDQVTPGWLVRAGLASCATTTIAMAAAQHGVALDRLEVHAASRSDARGVLGLAEPDGAPVYPGPQALELSVTIAARGVAPERLRALVESCQHRAPMSAALREAVPITLTITVGAA
jgi:uncharacterized OsmC-like protein